MRLAVAVVVLLAASMLSAKPARPVKTVTTTTPIAELRVQGGLEPGLVRRQLDARVAEVRRCHGDDQAAGEWQFELSFSVMPSGDVVGLGIAGAKNEATGTCLRASFATLAFPGANRTTTVESRWHRPVASGGFSSWGETCHAGLCIGLTGSFDARHRLAIETGLRGQRETLLTCLRPATAYQLDVVVHRGGKLHSRQIGGAGAERACVVRVINRIKISGVPVGTRIGVSVKRLTNGFGTVGTRLPSIGYARHRFWDWRGGAVAASELEARVSSRARLLHACYEREVMRNPGLNLNGIVEVRLEIAGNGKVASAKVAGVHSMVERCIAAQLQKIRFPKRGTPTDARFRIHFWTDARRR